MDRRSWTLLVALAAIWGASYMFIEIALRGLSPGVVAWARIVLAAMVLLAFAIPAGALRGLASSWRMIALLGAVQVAGPFLLIAAGQQEITSSLAGILVTTAPLFAAVLAIWVDHEERSSGLRLVGIVLGFGGVVALLGLDVDGSGAALIGGLAVVLASFGYAVGGFVVKHRFRDARPIGVAAAVMAASSLWLAPAAVLSAPAEAPEVDSLLALAVLGVVGTGLAFALYYELFSRVGPARTLLVAYLCPAFAVGYGSLLLGERVTAATISGLVLITAGSWLAAEGRLPWRARRVESPAPTRRQPAQAHAYPPARARSRGATS
jgi:drug/metabolite transporter (DMT)-like permease